MTRMEKYKSYRQEIEQSAKLGQSIVNSDKSILLYKQEIDNINPAILNSSKPETLGFVKGVTEISLKQKEIPSDVVKMFTNLNKAKSNFNQENISLMLFNMTENSILDNKDVFKEKWLAKNADYASLLAYRMQLNLNPESFEKDLEEKYADFIATNEAKEFAKLETISFMNQSRTSSYAFAISIAIAIIFGLLTCVLLGIKMAV